jgi:molybdopterin converting factor small subunit
MVSGLRIYFEGDPRLRPGFRQFLSEIAEVARSKKWHFDLIATDGTPVDDFRAALETHYDTWNVLLLDREDALEALRRNKGLEGCDPASIFWMVQIMESWFLADLGALKVLYKSHLNEAALKRNPKVEEISKADVLASLRNATNGEYHKVKHGTKLLELIDPAKVRNAAPNRDRMFRVILAGLR